VTLDVANGDLALLSTAGLTLTDGDGTDGTLAFSGSLADINAALAQLQYTGNQDYNGTDTLNIAVNDGGNTGTGGGLNDSTSVQIIVAAVNDAPVANDDLITLAQNQTKAFDALGNDTDADVGQTISVASVNGVAATVGAAIATTHGDITILAGGTLSYKPDANYVGADAFTYVATDGIELSGVATVDLTVTPGIFVPGCGGSCPIFVTFAGEQIADTTAVDLTSADLGGMLAEALNRCAGAGLSQEQLALTADTEITIADLAGTALGVTQEGGIVIDVNAAGKGWYIDETPADDFEFTDAGGPDGVDLLSVVMHEMGHIIGLEHVEDAHSVMTAELAEAERLVPNMTDIGNTSIEGIAPNADNFEFV